MHAPECRLVRQIAQIRYYKRQKAYVSRTHHVLPIYLQCQTKICKDNTLYTSATNDRNNPMTRSSFSKAHSRFLVRFTEFISIHQAHLNRNTHARCVRLHSACGPNDVCCCRCPCTTTSYKFRASFSKSVNNRFSGAENARNKFAFKLNFACVAKLSCRQ